MKRKKKLQKNSLDHMPNLEFQEEFLSIPENPEIIDV